MIAAKRTLVTGHSLPGTPIAHPAVNATFVRGGGGTGGACPGNAEGGRASYTEASADTLPKPMLKGGGHDASASTCAMGQLLLPLLVRERTRGFNLTDEGRNKWGYVT